MSKRTGATRRRYFPLRLLAYLPKQLHKAEYLSAMTRQWIFLFTCILPGMTAVSCGKPLADFVYDSAEHTAPALVVFTNNSKGADRFEWNFGDGNTASGFSARHEYKSSGNYAVQLKAIKGKKSVTATKRIFIKAPLDCLVEIETSYGNMLIRLSNATPLHRDNFIELAENGFFDGLLFHRIIEGFMIQGGDPASKDAQPEQILGMGDPGYTIPAEFVDSLVHVKGALCAARQGDEVNPGRRSSGSQFYIVQGRPLTLEELNMAEARKGFRYTKPEREIYLAHGGAPQLDRAYTVFGQVIKGLEVIDRIAEAKTDAHNRPLSDIKMKVRVIK